VDQETRDVAREGPGPVYDNALRWLVANNLAGVCRWLGEDPGEAPLMVSEALPASTMYTDVLVRTGPERLLHVEFVRRVEADFGARMLEYRSRIMRARPGMALVQHVLVLAEGYVPARFGDDEYGFRLHVTYLREHEPKEFLAQAPLAPLAVLARAADEQERISTLHHVLRAVVKGEPDATRATGLVNAAGLLAAMHLTGRTIRRIWKETYVPLFYREDIEKFIAAMEPADEEERLADIEYEKYRPTALVLDTLIRHRFGDDDRVSRIAFTLAQGPLQRAVAVIEDSDSLEALLSQV
jgi:hypothetical protein